MNAQNDATDQSLSPASARRPRRSLLQPVRRTAWTVGAQFARRRDSRGRLRMAALSWLVMYPMVTLLLVASAPLFDGAPIYLRTLVASLVMVPAMVWFIQPRLARLAGIAPRPVPKAPADYCL